MPILWGHSRAGPFTIPQGNHKLTALSGSPHPKDFALAVYVGLSSAACYRHLPDNVVGAQAQWLALSSNAKQLFTDKSAEYIPFDQPSFVVDAIREVYTQTR